MVNIKLRKKMKVKLTNEEIKEAIAEYIQRRFYIDSSLIDFDEAYVENLGIPNYLFSTLESIRDIEIKPREIPLLPQNIRSSEYESVSRLLSHSEERTSPIREIPKTGT